MQTMLHQTAKDSSYVLTLPQAEPFVKFLQNQILADFSLFSHGRSQLFYVRWPFQIAAENVINH